LRAESQQLALTDVARKMPLPCALLPRWSWLALDMCRCFAAAGWLGFTKFAALIASVSMRWSGDPAQIRRVQEALELAANLW
jgi:hypothetical protein